MPLMNTDIKTYDMRGLQQAMKELGQPAFRAKQIYEWLWYKHADSFDKMTNLSLALREELASKFSLVDAQAHRQAGIIRRNAKVRA